MFDSTAVWGDRLSSRFCDRIDEWPSDRDRNTMFARALVVFVGRTGARNRDAVVDADEVFVLARPFVTAVSNLNALGDECEFEGFVLGSLGDTSRELPHPTARLTACV